jgi:predicted Rdx family selenoprotein
MHGRLATSIIRRLRGPTHYMLSAYMLVRIIIADAGECTYILRTGKLAADIISSFMQTCSGIGLIRTSNSGLHTTVAGVPAVA